MTFFRIRRAVTAGVALAIVPIAVIAAPAGAAGTTSTTTSPTTRPARTTTTTTLPVPPPIAPSGEPAWHRLHFPVQEKVSFSDDFGAPRAGGRSHQGNDIMGAKLNHELAVVDGTVSSLRVDDGTGISGNMLTLKGADG